MDPSLYQAVSSGDYRRFDELIRHDPRKLLEVTTDYENTILHVAAKTERLLMADRIIGLYPALLHKTNGNGDSPLHVAARLGRLRMCQALVNRAGGLEVEVEKKLLRMQNLDHETALHDAVRNGHYEIVRLLIRSDPYLTRVMNKAGDSPLFLAVDRKFYQIARYILEAASAVCSFKGRNNMNVLHAAIIRSERSFKVNVRVIDIIASLLMLDKYRRFPLSRQYEVDSIGTDFMEEVVRRSASSISESDSGGWTPLHYAAYLGFSEIVELILDHDISLAHVKDQKGKSAIHLAAKAGNTKVIQKLIKKCPDAFESLDQKGRTALHIAAEEGRVWVVRLLLMTPLLEFLTKARDKNGNTSFHLAASRGHTRVLDILSNDTRVDRGAMNNAGLTALDIALTKQKWKENVGFGFLQDGIIDKLMRRGSLRSMEQIANLKGSKQQAVETQEEGKSQNAAKAMEASHVTKRGKYSMVVSTLIASVTFSAICNLGRGNAISSENKEFSVFIFHNSTAFGISLLSIAVHFFASMFARIFDVYAGFINLAFMLNYGSAMQLCLAYMSVLDKSLGKGPSIFILAYVSGCLCLFARAWILATRQLA